MRSIPSRVLSLRLPHDFYDALRALPGFENPSDAARALLLDALARESNPLDVEAHLKALEERSHRVERVCEHLLLNLAALRAEFAGVDPRGAVEEAQRLLDEADDLRTNAGGDSPGVA